MKKILEVLGGLSLMASISGNTISCSKPDYTFKLTTVIGEVIDTFDRRDVEDYYFTGFFTIDEDNIRIFINFKSTGLKNYHYRSGNCAYWLKQLVEGLGIKPSQEKYGQKSIPDWAWRDAGLRDYEHNKPKD